MSFGALKHQNAAPEKNQSSTKRASRKLKKPNHFFQILESISYYSIKFKTCNVYNFLHQQITNPNLHQPKPTRTKRFKEQTTNPKAKISNQTQQTHRKNTKTQYKKHQENQKDRIKSPTLKDHATVASWYED